MTAEPTTPPPEAHSAKVEWLVAASDHAFDLAAALAELVLLIDQLQRDGAPARCTAADVSISDSRLALQAFHAWVEAAP